MNQKIVSIKLVLAAASLGLAFSGVLMLASCDEAEDSKEQPPARVSRDDPGATMPPRLADPPRELRSIPGGQSDRGKLERARELWASCVDAPRGDESARQQRIDLLVEVAEIDASAATGMFMDRPELDVAFEVARAGGKVDAGISVGFAGAITARSEREGVEFGVAMMKAGDRDGLGLKSALIKWLHHKPLRASDWVVSLEDPAIRERASEIVVVYLIKEHEFDLAREWIPMVEREELQAELRERLATWEKNSRSK